MSEPKKETVRIVLPPRREGQPLASTPRETAMINLPPKPVPASAEAPAAPQPGGLQPPSAPSIPKPPSFPGAPKPPGMPGSAPNVPPSAPGVPKAAVPSSGGMPAPALKSPVGPAPAAVKPQAKKETAKIASGIAVKPQATVRLQPRPQPTQAASAGFKIQSAEIASVEETTEEEIPMNLSIAALATAIIALVFQIWMMTA
jgi:hypothetical protein